MDIISIISNNIEEQLQNLDNNRKEIIVTILGKQIAVEIDNFENNINNNTKEITNSILNAFGLKNNSPSIPQSPTDEFRISDPINMSRSPNKNNSIIL